MQEISALSIVLAVSIVVAIAAALGLRFIRDKHVAAREKELERRRNRPPRIAAHPWHAVAVAGTGGCGLSAQLSGRRFLSADAPLLPLPGCAVRPCRCRYVHYADRRAEDRRFPFGVRQGAQVAAQTERRRGDRRKAVDLAFI
jgi:hypothetical protein